MSAGEVSLRRFSPADAAAVERWFNERDAVRGLVEQRSGFGRADAERWTEAAMREDAPDRKWAVALAGRDAPVGFTAVYGLGRAAAPELGILIGEPAAWGRGVGRRAYELTIACAFGELGAWRLSALVPGDNERSLRLHRAVGFTHEGTLRSHLRRAGGELVDGELFGLLREEWGGDR
jgi:RimJ/RimL family protein N-acetyltransferase